MLAKSQSERESIKVEEKILRSLAQNIREY